MPTSIRRAGRQLWVVSLVLAGVVMLGVAVGLPLYLNSERATSEHNITACVAAWARKYSIRADILAKYGLAKDVALRLTILRVHGPPALYEQARLAYLAASNAYNQELKADPPPVFTCHGFTSAVAVLPSPIPAATDTITATKTATATKTTTVTRTASSIATSTRIVPVPGPTVTRTVPGPTVTRTQPSCLTAPPSCVIHGPTP